MKTMAVLMLIFAVSIGYATIVENDFGTMTAKAEIYNAKWFEVLLALLVVNLVLNIIKYKMFSWKKANIFIFHIAFIIILLGAAVTRFIGFEGTMHIREGATASSIVSSTNYFNVDASYKNAKDTSSQQIYLSKRDDNDLSADLKVADKSVEVSLVKYIPDAMEEVVVDPKGQPILSLMVTGGGRGKPVALAQGDSYDAGNFVLDFGSKHEFNKPVISVYVKNGKPFMRHEMILSYLKMDDRSQGKLKAADDEPFATRTLFSTEMGSFVLKQFMPHASTKMVSNPKARAKMAGTDAFVFRVKVGNTTREVNVYGQSGKRAQKYPVMIEGVLVNISYGAKEIPLPFSIKLNKFQLDRYPGSMSPASYASKVVLIDKEKNINEPYRIYMNHVLEYRGYRFFQASYDRDERGTVLSVNHDPGTIWSYIGYALLALGMYWSLFSKKHRFAQLSKIAQKARDSRVVGLLLAGGLMFTVATPSYSAELNPALKTIISFNKAHADTFGKLIIQDSKGRMKPMDTLSSELLAKMYRHATLDIAGKTLDSNQVILGMMLKPDAYRDLKIIRTGNKAVNRLIGAKENAKYASFSQFFMNSDTMSGYKLRKMLEEASRKAPKNRSRLDNALLKIDERVNVAYMVYTGSLIKIWPKPDDVNNKWLATIEALQTLHPKYSKIIRNDAVVYFSAIDKALQSGDWSKADAGLAKIAAYQHKYGASVYPTSGRIKAEIFYNHANIFETIYPIYLLLGFILLILSFVKILKPSFNLNIFSKVTFYLIVVLFIAHTVGLVLRWYISGHAPWSNGFESMTYIAWATVFAGFIFSRRSAITMAATGILAGLILFVAHLSWMDPTVTNLVPVLHSYWLSIHVSMITASYGFLGLGALLGFITILLFIFKNEKNEKHITASIKELNAINEMSLMVGLTMISVGNFLGGVWANESWGRYWSWDPKETWALVTILVYAVVVHIRFIKSIYKDFNYSVISLVAFSSVLMTYFGVNYYLAGMHSYAKGDAVPIPDFVPMTYTIVFLTIALAMIKDLKFNKHNINNHLVIGALLVIGQSGIFYATYTSGKPMYVLIVSFLVDLFLLFSFSRIVMQKRDEKA